MKGFKTVGFNILAAILPVLEVSGTDLGLTGESALYYGTGVAVINMILRGITTTPIFKK
jgi:hypothetical protein